LHDHEPTRTGFGAAVSSHPDDFEADWKVTTMRREKRILGKNKQEGRKELFAWPHDG
jgi:hypothetical protein